MATLPIGMTLSGIQITDEPGRTWYIDSGRIQGYCDGLQAVKQAVDILLNTDRFRWQIYDSSTGMDYRGLIGEDPGYVASELQRRLTDALRMDTRILGISNFNYSVSGNVLTASFMVNTVYGVLEQVVEVSDD